MLGKSTSRTLQNQYIIKKYNENCYKLIFFKFDIKQSGYEVDRKIIIDKVEREIGKEECNISRTRSKIWEYASCNKFDAFITLTLNKDKMNRYDLDAFIKALGQFIRDNRKRKGSDIEYVLIPEKHKDGAYHMHGLIKGINSEELKAFTLQDKIPIQIKNLIKKGRTIYNWLPYSEKFGWVTLEEIQNQEAVSKYITKYIKKDVGVSVNEKNKKSYYCSRGLKKAEVIKKGTFPTLLRNALQFDFENDYVGLIDLNSLDYENLSGIL